MSKKTITKSYNEQEKEKRRKSKECKYENVRQVGVKCDLWVYVIIFCNGLLCMLCMCFYVFRFMYVRFMYVRLSRPACHHPPQNISLHSLYYPTSSPNQAVFGVFAIVFAVYFSLLFLQLLITFYIYFYTLYIAFLFYGSYISIVFKNGSMVLQRTMYDPFLRAILIPNYTYFQPVKP